MGVDTTRKANVPVGRPDSHVGCVDAARLCRNLKSVADDLYEAACELCGFGPYAEKAITDRTGRSIDSRIMAMREQARGLLEQLHDLRSEYLRDQLLTLGVGERASGLKLHIGCGTQQPDGWINIDFYPAPLSMAASWELPFRAESTGQIVISRVPEMLFYPVELRRFLGEVYRVLAPDGIVQIMVDDGSDERPEPRSLESAYRKWADGLGHRSRLDYLLSHFGVHAGAQSKDPGRQRRWDISAWIHLLVDERFVGVTYTAVPSHGYDAIRAIGAAGAQGVADRPYILARKPLH